MAFSDSLRGYAYPVHLRGFRCVYCGLDGTVWPNWLSLSWDHLLPKGHPERDDDRYIVTACRFCNEARNRTPFATEGLAPTDIVNLKRKAIAEVRREYRAFWEANVASIAGSDGGQ